jgi:carbonic anhydrase
LINLVLKKNYLVSMSPTSNSNNIPKLAGSNFNDRFDLIQFHFHWGQDDEGSEHLVDDKSFPLELHLVHKNEATGNFNFLKQTII